MVPSHLYRLVARAPEWTPLSRIAEELGVRQESLMRHVEEARAKGLLLVERRSTVLYELTEEGARRAREGLPEYLLLRGATCSGETCTVEVSGGEAEIALANLARLGVRPSGGRIQLPARRYAELLREIEARQRALADPSTASGEVLAELVRRKLLRRVERHEIYVKAAVPLETLKPVEVKTALTSEDIRSGAWRSYVLKPFDLSVEVPPAPAPVPHFFAEFLDYVREVMVGLGFQEARGPLLEVEFWNFDALFQAQDHPAREVHDTFFVEGETPERPPQVLMEAVGRMHEERWEYRWDPARALNPVLRTQTTAVTIRAVAERGDGEYKVFSVGRVFRPERLDPKHSMEFHQLDGIVAGRGLSFKHLLGQLEQIAKALGMERVRFRPAYFPFTSPSVEVYAQHPTLGWVEFGGAGIFRPEVTEPLGVRRSRVLAWGWGLDRIAMILLGIDDIRELFTRDPDRLREYHARWMRYRLQQGSRGRGLTL